MKIYLYLVLLIFSFASCDLRQQKEKFKLMKPEATGVDFVNNLEASPHFNIFTYLYFYNGGGVASGDFNGDGWQDLYFTSNQEDNKLYLNKGNFKFEDITSVAGVAGQKGWTTGVTVVDINGDEKLDLYVSQVGDYQSIMGHNQLFINMGNNEKGIPQFEERSEKYNLDLVGFSTQASFFDYDLDGDLDMYMLNHSVHSNGTYVRADERQEFHPYAGDKLLENQDGKFVDVTEEAGIYNSALGYGLGISIGDINWDGYPDIYVGNDFHEDDYLYINNGDGTFSEQLDRYIQHTSRFSMGNDIGDINNDGLMDVVSLDMLPDDPVKLKSSAAEDAYDVYNYKLTYGYSHQFARNTLQLNRGNGHFSEIGLLSGMYATDWSWAGLLADLDLDGYKDLFVANGIKRRSNDMDYISFVSNEAIQHKLEGDLTEQDLTLIEKMPVVKIPNKVFRYNGKYKYEEVSAEWGLDQPSFSNGAVYVDLDNDGDLDLVTNNIDDPAFIFQNNTISPNSGKNNYLKIRFKGDQLNAFGIGAKVIIPMDSGRMVFEQYTTRGYQSAVSPEIVAGLGNQQVLDSLSVIWPDGRFQILTDIEANQVLTLQQSEAKGKFNFEDNNNKLFEDITDEVNVEFRHMENNFNEFNREALMPHMVSSEGPALAVGDVNNDLLEDIYIGGGKWQSGKLYLQQPGGKFVSVQEDLFRNDSIQEDVDAAFVDVNQDNYKDLFVVSGGNEFSGESKNRLPRLYINKGNGQLEKSTSRLPDLYLTGACVAPGDYDQDGDVDLFIGSRAVPWNYGVIPESYLLENDGTGHFQNVTSQIAEGLSRAGMIKDAVWADVDQDNDLDLIAVGEWMAPAIFMNDGDRLRKIDDANTGLNNACGWWNSIQPVDYDRDGDMDFLMGNLGENSKLKASPEEPLEMFIKDFDGNGKKEQVITCYMQGKRVIFHTKDELTNQLPHLKKKFLSYKKFAKADLHDVFSQDQLDDAKKHVANFMQSALLENTGGNQFKLIPLPPEMQFAPINDFLVNDFDKDGISDVVSVGNFYDVNIQRGRYDASYGTCLKISENGKWQVVPSKVSGLAIDGQSRKVKRIKIGEEDVMIIVRNNDTPRFIRWNPSGVTVNFM